MSAELASSNCAYRLDRDPGRSVPMTALASPTTLGASGGTKFSPHDTYSTSSVPMSSMPSSSYSSPCSEKMRRAGEVRSSFIVASSSSSAIEAGRTAFLPTLAPTRRRVMRVGIGAARSALGRLPGAPGAILISLCGLSSRCLVCRLSHLCVCRGPPPLLLSAEGERQHRRTDLTAGSAPLDVARHRHAGRPTSCGG